MNGRNITMIVFCFLIVLPMFAEGQKEAELSRTIRVVGIGEASTQPDVAFATLGVQTLAPTAGEATRENKGTMDSILKELKASGVSEKDIDTTQFSIHFEPVRWPEPQPRAMSQAAQSAGDERMVQNARPPSGAANSNGQNGPTEKRKEQGRYRVNNMVRITIRDLPNVGAVLDAAIRAGANQVYGVNFGVTDTEELERRARLLALEDAEKKAEHIAQDRGLTLKGIRSIDESKGGVGVPSPVLRGFGGAMEEPTPISPGEVHIRDRIEVVYSF